MSTSTRIPIIHEKELEITRLLRSNGIWIGQNRTLTSNSIKTLFVREKELEIAKLLRIISIYLGALLTLILYTGLNLLASANTICSRGKSGNN